MTELDERLELAVNMALDAADIPRQLFLSDALDVDWKADASPVTRADKDAEERLRQHIEAHCPDDAIVGEEFPDKDGSSGFKWYLDPIDGTQSFIRGVPLFGSMVALEHNATPVAGVIVFPALGEIIYAANGSGCWWARNANEVNTMDKLERRAATVSTTAALSDATVVFCGLELFAEHQMTAAMQRLVAATRISRGWSDCYAHYLVATGRADVVVDPIMHIWDNAPLLPIVSEAGGRFTDLDGNAVITSPNAVSTNGLLHAAVLQTWSAG